METYKGWQIAANEAKALRTLERIVDDAGGGITFHTLGSYWVQRLEILYAPDLVELPECMKDLTSLEFLSFRGLPNLQLPDWLSELESLESLSFYKMPYTEVPEQIRPFERYLEFLLFEDTPIESIPSWFAEFEYLDCLILDNTRLKEFPPEILSLITLKSLTIKNSPVEYIPSEISALWNLNALYIQNASLFNIPREIGKLEKLSELFLYQNRLESIPDSVTDLPNLIELDLEDNQLTSLPEEIGKLTKLQSLDVSENYLKRLPDSIGNCGELVYLHAERNYLETIPVSLLQLKNLEEIVLNDNPFVENPTNEIRDIVKGLKEIDRDFSAYNLDGWRKNGEGKGLVEIDGIPYKDFYINPKWEKNLKTVMDFIQKKESKEVEEDQQYEKFEPLIHEICDNILKSLSGTTREQTAQVLNKNINNISRRIQGITEKEDLQSSGIDQVLGIMISYLPLDLYRFIMPTLKPAIQRQKKEWSKRLKQISKAKK